MKSIVLVLVSFVIFTFTLEISGVVGSSAKPREHCEEIRHSGNFTCVENEDGTYNATYDCHLNNQKKLELKLQYPNFPKKTNHLTIQNCESLVLDLQCETLSKLPNEEVNSMIHISHLHILNITHMMIRKEMANHSNYQPLPFRIQEQLKRLNDMETEDSRIFLSSEEMEYEEREFYYLNDLVANTMTGVTFENIKHAYIEEGHIPSWLFRCDKTENDKLEYFKIINVKALHFKGFSEEISSLNEFIIDNVTVMPKNAGKLKIANTKAVVKITNSNLVKMNQIFEGNVFKVIITGNKAKTMSAFALSVEANEFIFTGNIIDRISTKAFDILSLITHVTNNKIHFIEDRAFAPLLPKPFDPTLPNITKKVFNFSNNELDILSDDIIRFPGTDDAFDVIEFDYDAINVSNNSISCSCQNVRWFNRLLESRYRPRLYPNFWIRKDNQNKCSNINNCTLAQVMNNFHELCTSKYQCPLNASFVNSDTFFIKDIENILGNTLHINREISDTNLKILEILKKNADNHNHDNESLLTINTFCLILLLLLCFVIFGYLVLVKYGKVRELRPRRFSSLRDTEMNSRASLNP